jgi:hypothetical protein
MHSSLTSLVNKDEWLGHPELLYTHEKNPQYPSEGRLGYPSTCADTAKKKKKKFHMLGI